MAKLKCWRKSTGQIQGADTVIMWEHKKKKGEDVIAINKPFDEFLVGRFTEQGTKNIGQTKTKKEALSSANKYMKSHDKC